MRDVIWLSERFSSMKTSTLVTAPGRATVGAAVDVGVAVCVVAPATFGGELDDVGPAGLFAVEHPDATRARRPDSAAPRVKRVVMEQRPAVTLMRLVKR